MQLGYDNVFQHRSFVRPDIPPCSTCCPSTSHADGDHCCIRHGQHSGSARDFNPPVSGSSAPRSCSPSREHRTPECHDTFTCNIAQTGSGCKDVEEGRRWPTREEIEWRQKVNCTSNHHSSNDNQSWSSKTRRRKSGVIVHHHRFYPAICTSWSAATFATIVCKKTSTFSPSRMRNGPLGGTDFS